LQVVREGPAAKLHERYGIDVSAVVGADETKTMFAPVSTETLAAFAPALASASSGGGGGRATIVAVGGSSGAGAESQWTTRGYVLCDKGLKLRTVAELRLSLQIKPSAKAHIGKTISFALGQVKIVKAAALGRIPKQLSGALAFSRPRWREDGHDKSWKLSGLLEWQQVSGDVDTPEYFDVWCDDGEGNNSASGVAAGAFATAGASYVSAGGHRFVCRVHGYCARVRVRVKPAQCKSIRFYVQPVTAADLKPNVSECTNITLQF
jgi:hypothetical protein